jgi:hypothetical protein
MKFERSACPITNVLDILGNKWTLLVIRNLVLGKRRYQEFMSTDLPGKSRTLRICFDKEGKGSRAGIGGNHRMGAEALPGH